MDLLPAPLDRPQPFIIGGRWVLPDDGRERVVENPSDLDSPVATVVDAGPDHVDEAVATAREAARGWQWTPAAVRAALLRQVAEALRERAEPLGELLSREEGKTRPEGVGEVRRAADIFAYYAQRALDPVGEILRGAGDAGVEIAVERRPLGVVALITPWNYPAAIPAWKLAPALAYGNVAILKPAEQTPLSAIALAKICHEVGLPNGVVQLLTGGGDAGRALVEHEGVDGISFTGSTAVGRKIAAAAAARLVPSQLELGGKNALVVLDDADLDIAVDCAVRGAFHSTGQRCTASSRIVVTEGIYGRFAEAVAERARALRVGPALDPDSDYGPVIDEAQLRADLAAVEAAEARGLAATVRGGRVDGRTRGHYLTPTLFVDTSNEDPINREEVFGPVATIIPARGYEDALAIANDTPYGLVAGIVTRSLAHASHFRRASEAGMVMINMPTAGQDLHAPFGGRKGSGFGPKEQGSAARAFYTSVRTAYVSPGPVTDAP